MKTLLPAIVVVVAIMLPQMVVAQSPSDWQNTANYIRTNQPPGCGSSTPGAGMAWCWTGGTATGLRSKQAAQ